jgi:hypothetical protein
MAKGGNTWCKKLTSKGKAYALKKALGNEKGVMSYCARVKNTQARDLDRGSMEDKPQPGGPKAPPPEGYLPLPRTAGWKPKRHGDTRWGNKYSHA